ncbi:MAG: class I adenylate-forming enzyme family protein [Alphaproteobacteria bacterium]
MKTLRLIESLRNKVKNSPQSNFLTDIETGKVYSYLDLYETTSSFYSYFSEMNLKKGSRVIYLTNNDWYIFPLIISFSLLEITLIPINPALHPNDISRIFEDVNPNLVISLTKDMNIYSTNVPWLDISKIKNKKDLRGKIDEDPSEKPVLIMYTSGSSGQCKGVMLSEHNIIHGAKSIIDFYKLSSTDRLFCVLPLYHMNAIMVTGMVPLIVGAEILMSDAFSFANSSLYLERVKEHKPTILSLIPSILSVLIKTESDQDLSSLGVKFSFCGAAPLSASLWKQFEEKFNLPVYQGYGLTETTFWATLTPTDNTKDYNSVGVPYNCDLQIKKVKSEKAGEIVISGLFVTKGYLNKDEGFDSNGYFKTGDLGCIGENGQLYIMGRIKDIIIKNGINIYPQSINDVLSKNPNIEDCASLGIDDDISGEKICAVCVPGEGSHITEVDVKAYAKENLSSYMIPDKVLFTQKLPRGATGKIRKKELIEMVKSELAKRNKKVV